MSDVIRVPFSRLVFHYREIGVHRGRMWGFRDVFGFPTLRDLPFVELATKVKSAYENRDVPPHEGWPAQREALRWLVDKGRDGIYALDEQGIEVRRGSNRRMLDEQGIEQMREVQCVDSFFYIFDGHHRALALFILGDETIRARINSGEWIPSLRYVDGQR